MKKEFTPIEKVSIDEHTSIYVKRDDLFEVAGVKGGKARTCWYLAQGATGLITAGSRVSPQVKIVSAIAKELNIPCRVHVPSGEFTDELNCAKDNGAEVIQHKPGYNSVIIARAVKDSLAHPNWTYIPFGMEHFAAILETSWQVANLAQYTLSPDAKRIVIPVGSGMTLAGVLWGLRMFEINIPVLGVCVGANPIKRLNKYAPKFWQEKVTLVGTDQDYHKRLPMQISGIELDPVYEAKCVKFLENNDLFWIVGKR